MSKVILTILALLGLFLTRQWYLPLILRPGENFLYASGPPYYTQLQYKVEGGKVHRKPVPEPRGSPLPARGEVQLFVYDTQRNHSRKVSWQEAQLLALRWQPTVNRGGEFTPANGFVVRYPKGDCPVCDTIDFDNVWLEGWTITRRLNIDVSNDRSFQFLGWIVE